MIGAQQALHEILLIGLDEEPQDVLLLKARAFIEKFKANLSASHQESASSDDKRLHVARSLEHLRDAVDREIDRRVDEDLADTVCDLLEHLSDILHAETTASPELASNVAVRNAAATVANEAEHRHSIIAEAAYLRAARRHFAPGRDVEDWLAAESALGLRDERPHS
jgi:hypothetical protein